VVFLHDADLPAYQRASIFVTIDEGATLDDSLVAFLLVMFFS